MVFFPMKMCQIKGRMGSQHFSTSPAQAPKHPFKTLLLNSLMLRLVILKGETVFSKSDFLHLAGAYFFNISTNSKKIDFERKL